ncbi:MAG TPA: RluA family pseudouridine synthase [Candidatus Deferrimicrobium sp.]|nr:RluA family pseudouridine synthase [Candidatus Deferrimicrobium sp.]
MEASEPAEGTTHQLQVPAGLSPQRVDVFLASSESLNLTRTRVQKLIVDKLVLVNGMAVTKSFVLSGGETVFVTVPPVRQTSLEPEAIPLDIIYEDEFLAVINKPAGLVTHPGAGNYSGTLANALVHHFESLASGSGVERPGIVHRLDKNTSGLILIARTDDVYLRLQTQMQKHAIKRTYLALVCGHMREEEGLIDLPIGRSLKDRKKMAVTILHARQATTTYKLRDRYRTYDLLEVRLLTGRTHQIRVHFSHLGHPVLGDSEYGGRQKWHQGVFGPERQLGRKLLEIIDRQALHAARLEFVHPVTARPVLLESDLPEDIRQVLSLLDKEGR